MKFKNYVREETLIYYYFISAYLAIQVYRGFLIGQHMIHKINA
jgi:hypothetical protein